MVEKNGDFIIGGEPLSKILETASQIVAASVKVPCNEAPERQGGYLVIRQKHSSTKVLIDGTPVLIERIGRCRPQDVSRYHKLALEKCERLSMTRLTGGHMSSYQSRDTQNDKWGGAIIAGNFIISFSGLKELLDEAVVLVLAIRMHWLDIREAEAIAEISNNTFIKPLFNLATESGRNEPCY